MVIHMHRHMGTSKLHTKSDDSIQYQKSMSRSFPLQCYALLALLVLVRGWSQPQEKRRVVTSSFRQAWEHYKPPQGHQQHQLQGKVDVIPSRRTALGTIFNTAFATTLTASFLAPTPAMATGTIDVNNALAREFTAFPGLYPTVATKIVNAAKEEPFKSKKDVYAILNEAEQERLRQYDKSIIISKPDKSLQQFKTSQICKYECGGRTSSAYRDQQIKEVQAARSQ